MDKEIKKLSEAVASFTEFVGLLSARQLELTEAKTWGAREVLIHLVFWHEQYAQIASETLAGQTREMLPGTFQEINAWAVAEDSAVPIRTLFRRWNAAHEKLVRISRQPAAGSLKFSLREGSKEWPFAVLVRLAAGHIQNHETKLRKSLGMSTRGRQHAALV